MSGTYNTAERLKLPDDKHEPERRRLEELSRSTAFLAIRAKLEAELAREQADLERASAEDFRYHQGAIHGLRVALDLPDTIYERAGGKRRLFVGDIPQKQSAVHFMTLEELNRAGNYPVEQAGVLRIGNCETPSHCDFHVESRTCVNFIPATIELNR